jgi:phosphomannomutase
VATEYDTADDGAGPGAGETAIRCVLYGLDPSRDYTIRASYNELMTNYTREEAATESQYAVATLEGVPENIQMIPDKEHIVLAPGETTEISFEFDGLTDSYIELMSSTDEEVVELYGGSMSDSDDYKKGTITDTAGGKSEPTGLPSSNVLYYVTESAVLVVRPSGTEPKVKVYFMAKGGSSEEVKARLDALKTSASAMIG